MYRDRAGNAASVVHVAAHAHVSHRTRCVSRSRRWRSFLSTRRRPLAPPVCVMCVSGLEGDGIRSRHLRALLRVCKSKSLLTYTGYGRCRRPRTRAQRSNFRNRRNGAHLRKALWQPLLGAMPTIRAERLVAASSSGTSSADTGPHRFALQPDRSHVAAETSLLARSFPRESSLHHGEADSSAASATAPSGCFTSTGQSVPAAATTPFASAAQPSASEPPANDG